MKIRTLNEELDSTFRKIANEFDNYIANHFDGAEAVTLPKEPWNPELVQLEYADGSILAYNGRNGSIFIDLEGTSSKYLKELIKKYK